MAHGFRPILVLIGLLLPLLIGGSAILASGPVQGRVDANAGPAAPLARLAQGTATPTPTPCDLAWRVVGSPNQGTGSNTLNALAAVSASDVWAVGYYSGTTYQTLTEHWDGNSWSIISSPNLGSNGNVLIAAAGLAPNDVWTVGYYYNGGIRQTLTEHWNGSNWIIVPSPNQGTNTNFLWSVTPVAADDVWAVGWYDTGTSYPTLIEHWNGSSWTIVSSPNPGPTANTLRGVAAVTVNDVWAVGFYYVGTGNDQTLIEHWDGSSWSIVPSPNQGTDSNRLWAVTARAADDVWAVGDYYTGSWFQTLTEHWDGSNWSIVPSPSQATGDYSLGAVTELAANDVWAVGYYNINLGTDQTLSEHWNGSNWSIVPSPNQGTGTNFLVGVAAVSATDVWTVGYDYLSYGSGGTTQTLTEHYNGPCIAPTRTATPPPRATATPVAPTPSATRTPPAATQTTCTISFSDVHPTDYFYTPVLYLACRDVISGYADGTFRPFANTTRAQQVKIVVLGFQKAINTPAAGQYTFTDVPPTFPFFALIETAAADGMVSGYICGGVGEPCDAQHRPYFRPYADMTRGQLSKIVVLAAGWPLQNPPAPGTFEDMLPGSAFYQFVETAVCHTVVSGYGCGGPGEPCDPQHRPYFRPSGSATRGQIAKIVYLSLTAGGTCPGR